MTNWYITDPSLSIQVKLELIRQAESLEQVKEILEEGVSEAGSPPADASWAITSHWNQRAQTKIKHPKRDQ